MDEVAPLIDTMLRAENSVENPLGTRYAELRRNAFQWYDARATQDSDGRHSAENSNRCSTRLRAAQVAGRILQEQVDTAQEDIGLGGLHGDLATWQVVVEAYVPTLPLLGVALKRRKKSVVEVEVEIRSSDGTGWEHVGADEESEQSAPEEEVLRQLHRALMQPAQAVDGDGQVAVSGGSMHHFTDAFTDQAILSPEQVCQWLPELVERVGDRQHRVVLGDLHR